MLVVHRAVDNLGDKIWVRNPSYPQIQKLIHRYLELSTDSETYPQMFRVIHRFHKKLIHNFRAVIHRCRNLSTDVETYPQMSGSYAQVMYTYPQVTNYRAALLKNVLKFGFFLFCFKMY